MASLRRARPATHARGAIRNEVRAPWGSMALRAWDGFMRGPHELLAAGARHLHYKFILILTDAFALANRPIRFVHANG